MWLIVIKTFQYITFFEVLYLGWLPFTNTVLYFTENLAVHQGHLRTNYIEQEEGTAGTIQYILTRYPLSHHIANMPKIVQ